MTKAYCRFSLWSMQTGFFSLAKESAVDLHGWLSAFIGLFFFVFCFILWVSVLTPIGRETQIICQLFSHPQPWVDPLKGRRWPESSCWPACVSVLSSPSWFPLGENWKGSWRLLGSFDVEVAVNRLSFGSSQISFSRLKDRLPRKLFYVLF